MSDTYDVIIVGAGMAGMTLALALQSGGLRPVLVERQPFSTQLDAGYDGRASAIAYACFRQWRALGLGEALEAHACRMDTIMVTDGRHHGPATPPPLPFLLHFGAAEISDRSGDEPLGYMVENWRVRQALFDAIIARDVTLLCPDTVDHFTETVSGAEITLASGARLRAPLVVSAEGRGSALREQSGIGYLGWGYDQSAVVTTVQLEKPHNHTAFEHFLPSGPFAILPMTGNRACIVWSEHHAKAQALMRMDEAVFLGLLREQFGDFAGAISLAGPRFVYPLSLGLAESMFKGRLALLGDAAHGIHPIAGQGLNLGLKDVAALSEVLIEAARLGEDLGTPLVLERYSRWRRFDNVTTSVVMDGFVRVFSNSNPLLRLARGVGMSMVNSIPPLRRFFMEDAGAGTGDLPKLLKGELV